MDKVIFQSGASRTERRPTYDFIPTVVLQALAERFELGVAQHGEANYRQGLHDREYYRQVFNHLLHHLLLWRDGDTSDDHLQSAIWNCSTLVEFERLGAPHPWLQTAQPQPAPGATAGTESVGNGQQEPAIPGTGGGTGVQPPDTANQHGDHHTRGGAVVRDESRVETHQADNHEPPRPHL
jgi:hypothetical protein